MRFRGEGRPQFVKKAPLLPETSVALLPDSVDFTDRDFDALRARLIALVQSVFPDWTDFEVASFGNVLLEMFAFVGDVLTFYQDNLARESRLVTATQRKNVMALARMLGYRLRGAQAATAEVAFELARPPSANVTISAAAQLGAVHLEELAKLPWFARVDEVPAAIQYLCEKLLNERWSVVVVADTHWLSRCDKKAVETARSELKQFLLRVNLPAPLAAFDQVRSSIGARLGNTLTEGLWQELEDSLQIEERAGQPFVVNAAGTKSRRLLALLRAADAPIRVAEVVEVLGRMSNMPEEMLFFVGGRIGLAEHFPEFDQWVARLVPLALEVVRGQGPARQWLDVELLMEVSDDIVLPAWLDHWHLSAVLRQASELQYLGRGRFALPVRSRRRRAA